MKLAILTLVVLSSLGGEWLTDFSKAQENAEKDNKLILLNFSGSDWCGPCIKMKKEVFESDAFQSVATEKLVLVRADFPRLKKNKLSTEQKTHNEALAEKYNPNGKFPYTLLLTADGKIVKSWDGYTIDSHEKFVNELVNAIQSH